MKAVLIDEGEIFQWFELFNYLLTFLVIYTGL